MTTLTRRWGIATAAFTGNRAARTFWRERPDNAFTRDGYEVVDDFLPRSECDRLVSLADELMTPTSKVISGNCYTWVKSQATHGRNSKVQEILNVDDVDASIAELMASRVVQQLFEERVGEPVELYGFSIQIDGVDTTSKRDLHVDVLYPPMFKAFIYLTDVEERGDGPYTIVPGSHRYWGRKVANDLINAATTAGTRDMHRFVDHDRCVTILAPAGTMILSTQDAMHKGWNDHSRRPRYALIAHGTTAQHYDGRPLTDGRPLVVER